MNETPSSSHTALKHLISDMIENYLQLLDEKPENLYALVLKEVERGLFKTVLQHTQGNQTKAAAWLGLARGTLRKRLAEYGIV